MSDDLPRVLYIGGYSRSGSTLLDIVIGSSARAFGAGELSYLLDHWADPTRTCACGAAYRGCPFWGELYPEGPDPGDRDVVREIERRRHLPALRKGSVGADDAERYAAVQRRIHSFIRRRSGCELVVDSSKNARDAAGRPLALSQLAALDVRFLHLVRDSRSTAQSFVTVGSNWAAEGHGRTRRLPAVRAAVGWRLANDIAADTSRRLPSDRLRYEDLVREPARALDAVARLVGVPLDDVVQRAEDGGGFAPFHQVGGNRVRRSGEVVIRREVAGDQLSAARRALVEPVTRRGLRSYDYLDGSRL